MRIVFMGTPDFAVPCLNSIHREYEVIAVYSQPDKPKGRGKKVQPTPVKKSACEKNIPVFQPDNLKSDEAYEELKALKPDCIVVVAYGQILSKRILDIPKYGCINVHASLLPAYRGAAPINWAIVNGEKVSGVTTMFMDVGLDTGDMIHKEEVLIDPAMTAGELHDLLAQKGSELILKSLDALKNENAPREKQNNSESSYASMMDKEMSRIDWHMDAEKIHNRVRGFNPWPVAYTEYNGLRMKVYKSEIMNGRSQEDPGTILNVSPLGIEVATGNGILKIIEIQFPGSKKMGIKEYLLGHAISKAYKLGE